MMAWDCFSPPILHPLVLTPLISHSQELERHFEQAHKAYLESTEHRTQAFKQLTKNDASAARVIEKRMKKLIKLQVRVDPATPVQSNLSCSYLTAVPCLPCCLLAEISQLLTAFLSCDSI